MRNETEFTSDINIVKEWDRDCHPIHLCDHLLDEAQKAGSDFIFFPPETLRKVKGLMERKGDTRRVDTMSHLPTWGDKRFVYVLIQSFTRCELDAKFYSFAEAFEVYSTILKGLEEVKETLGFIPHCKAH